MLIHVFTKNKMAEPASLEYSCFLAAQDSQFYAYFSSTLSPKEMQVQLQALHPDAAHFAYVYMDRNGRREIGDSGEPKGSAEPMMMFLQKPGSLLMVVRYFTKILLGRTNLQQMYARCAEQALATRPFHQTIDTSPRAMLEKNHCIFGLGKGDCAIYPLLNDREQGELFGFFISGELPFESMASNGTPLPRWQILHGFGEKGTTPIYRYPGNEDGKLYVTHPFPPLMLSVLQRLETLLNLPAGTFNHCVTNWYRDGRDFIGPHQDKMLDIFRGFDYYGHQRGTPIVSLSLGQERTMQLTSNDGNLTQEFRLPSGSVFVLGLHTNRTCKHSILREPGFFVKGRVSLTIRRIATFLQPDGTLKGQGADKTFAEFMARS